MSANSSEPVVCSPAPYPARAVVDLTAIAANVASLRERADGAAVMAVVKADAYGHGLVPSARAAVAGGATWLGAAGLAEALALRAAGLTTRIFSWLAAPGADYDAALRADLDLSVSAPWALEEIAAAARRTGITARLHLKIDTGLGRNGCPPAAWADLVAQTLRAQASGAVRCVAVWSHLACADEPEHPANAAQIDAFTKAVAIAEGQGADLEVRHLANSAGGLAHPAAHFDLVRPGIACYGLSPLRALSTELGLIPAMTLSADLALVKTVPAGHGVSYGLTYTTTEPTTLALVPLGYGDGIPRHASNRGPVQVNGRRVHVAGRVCMDQFVVDLGPRSPACAGDRVCLFGPGRGGEPTAQDWAHAAQTISYEIVTRLGARVPREYIGGAP